MAQRIVYLCWLAHEIAGGIKMAFRHVETLRGPGFNATVATRDARLPGWFATDAPLLPLTAVAAPDDILVFPENDHDLLQHFAAANPKVVFCQNPYMLWRGLGQRRSYADSG